MVTTISTDINFTTFTTITTITSAPTFSTFTIARGRSSMTSSH